MSAAAKVRYAVVDRRGRVVEIYPSHDRRRGHELIPCPHDIKVGDIYDRQHLRFIKVTHRLIAEPAIIGVRTP
jgi:hypothetical protein